MRSCRFWTFIQRALSTARFHGRREASGKLRGVGGVGRGRLEATGSRKPRNRLAVKREVDQECSVHRTRRSDIPRCAGQCRKTQKKQPVSPHGTRPYDAENCRIVKNIIPKNDKHTVGHDIVVQDISITSSLTLHLLNNYSETKNANFLRSQYSIGWVQLAGVSVPCRKISKYS